MGKNIIVVKQGGIGDVLLATPVLAYFKKLWPDCRLTLMTFPNAQEVVQGLPFIDEVFPYEKKRDGFWKLFQKMRGKDIALFLDLSYRPALAATLARVPVRVGITHKRGKWLTCKIPWQTSMDHTYEPYVFGEIIRTGLGIDIPKEELEQLYAAEATSEEKADLAEKLRAHGIEQGDRYIVCSPKTAYFLKDWPLERWNELFTRLYEQEHVRTVIFGHGKLEAAWNPAAVVSLWNELSLRQVGALIQQASLLVNSCSMPEHMACAFGTPMVILYGYSEPERWAPRKGCRRVVTRLPCSPCDGYHGSTCKDPACMREISVGKVYEACREMLNLVKAEQNE